MTEEDVKIVEEFLNKVKVCLTDDNVIRDTIGTKDNPYIYIYHPREYEIWKSKLNLDENDMYISADGWVKVVKTPESMFHSRPELWKPDKEILCSMTRKLYTDIVINPNASITVVVDTSVKAVK